MQDNKIILDCRIQSMSREEDRNHILNSQITLAYAQIIYYTYVWDIRQVQ